MKPYSPIPRFVPGTDHSSLISRVLRSDVDQEIQRLDLITTTQLRLSLIDSGINPPEHITEGDMCVHLLFQTGEDVAYISVGGDRQAIHPGDFCWIPAGDSWQLSPNQLAITISVRSNSLALPIDPTHGDYRFDGYNRETIAPSASGISLSRWKITQPLTRADSGRDRIFVSIYNDLAMQFPGGVNMLHQGHTSVIRAGTGQITLVPNGLAHVLAIEIH